MPRAVASDLTAMAAKRHATPMNAHLALLGAGAAYPMERRVEWTMEEAMGTRPHSAGLWGQLETASERARLVREEAPSPLLTTVHQRR